MNLNSLRPTPGSRPSKKRLGRGIGSTLGKTSGKGHKGQKARSGGFHKVGFEGGQMPLQRRLPKIGFRSRSKKFKTEIRLSELTLVQGAEINLVTLKAAGLIGNHILRATIIDSGVLVAAKTIEGLKVTPGAREKILAAGGTIGE